MYVNSRAWDDSGRTAHYHRYDVHTVELNDMRTVRHDNRCVLVVMTTACDVTAGTRRPPSMHAFIDNRHSHRDLPIISTRDSG